MSAKTSAKFTDTYIRNLKPNPPRYVWDIMLPSFGMYVGKRKKTFVIVRDKGKRATIGTYPHMTLADARDKARSVLIGAQQPPVMTVSKAIERYLELRQPELSEGAWREYRRHLQRFPQYEHVEDVTTSQILDHLDTIPGQSDRAHAARALKTFFNWCVQREYCKRNPMSGMKMPKEPSARERVLVDEELHIVWRALDTFNLTTSQLTFQHTMKTLILTGQRANQIAKLEQKWVNYKKQQIDFPAEIMKSRRPHIHYFSHTAQMYLQQLPEQNRFTAFPSFTKRLQIAADIPHFTVHDLRRTYATIAARVGVAPHITERLIAHSTPEGRIAAIYNKHKYENEMREAAKMIEAHIVDSVNLHI